MIGGVRLFDVKLIFFMAFIGLIIAIASFVFIISERASGQRTDLQRRIKLLEQEVRDLKSKKID
jgi:hypothetical protein